MHRGKWADVDRGMHSLPPPHPLSPVPGQIGPFLCLVMC